MLERGAQLVDPIKPLTPLICSGGASAEAQSLRHSRWVECQRAADFDHRSVPFLPILFAKGVEDQPAIHDLQCQAPMRPQDPSGLSQDGLVLFFGVEESERVQHHGRVGAPGLQWQPAHIAAKPLRAEVTSRRNLLRAGQERGREIDANDANAAFGKGDRMTAMATADIDDQRPRGEPEQLVEGARFQPHLLRRRPQSPALCVAVLEDPRIQSGI